ncbi:sigma-70 family RNA polymerase sigma factor [Snodgrassella communis]|uniref:sigma-70 family RNA polymerase sigma factor n=1 Tax=Snodgrassella communis TaxID=2946699 RepID=UPI001EF6333B|nr:sigma-70 family RNA polymerase sigma factor [Snodgrassella communis]
MHDNRTQQVEEQMLVRKAQQGDAQIFSLLVNKYQRRLNHFLHRFTHDEQITLDLVQETFLKAYKALPQFRADSQFYTWLCCIGMNTAKSMAAISGREPQMITEIVDDDGEQIDVLEYLSDYHTPEGQLLNRELIDAVDEAIDNLPVSLRQPIILSEVNGLTYEEIAHVIGCPVGTVRSRIARAREILSVQIKTRFERE